MEKLNMKKKLPLRLLGALLAALLVLAVFPISAVATGTNEVGLALALDVAYPKGQNYAIVGDEVTVTVSITENPGVASMFLTAKYDTTAFELVSPAKLKTDTFEAGDFILSDEPEERKSLGMVNTDEAGTVIFNWIYSGALNGDLHSERNCEAKGAFAEFKLKVKNADLADERYKITVTPMKENFFAVTESRTGYEEVTVTGLTDDKLSATVDAREQYDVIYYENDGTHTFVGQKKIEGVPFELSVISIRDGYKFLGWATTAEGTAMYQPGATYSKNEALTLFAVWQKRAENVEFTVSNGSGVAKGKVSVDISLSYNGGKFEADKIELPLSFGNLQYVSVSDNTWTYEDGKLSWNGDLKKIAEGKLLTVTFNIPETAAVDETYTVSINDVKVSDSTYNYSPTSKNGTVTVISYILGDVNGDTKVNSSDASLILQYAASFPVNINTVAGDVNGDGKTNSSDASLILQYAAQLIPSFPINK